MSQLNVATPQRPWKATPKENLYPASLILLSAVASGVLVKTTGFNGKLGFVALFFFLATASMFFYKFRISGKAAAIDSIASSVMLTAALAVFLPVASILTSTLVKGVPGLHKTLFTPVSYAHLRAHET